MRIHYYLDIDENQKIKCRKCGHVIYDATENYKLNVPRAEKSPSEIPGRRPTKPEMCMYYEYYCPGCYTMLDVEAQPQGSPPVWDIQVLISCP